MGTVKSLKKNKHTNSPILLPTIRMSLPPASTTRPLVELLVAGLTGGKVFASGSRWEYLGNGSKSGHFLDRDGQGGKQNRRKG